MFLRPLSRSERKEAAMKNRGIALLLLILPASFAMAANFHVSPAGNDANSGTSDRPFATLQRASKRHGRRKLTPRGRSPCTCAAEPTIFHGPWSSSRKTPARWAAPIVWRAYGDEIPVISGGRRLEVDWKPHKNGIYKAAVPAGFISDQLFVNGQRQPMARYPKLRSQRADLQRLRGRRLQHGARGALERSRAAATSTPCTGPVGRLPLRHHRQGRRTASSPTKAAGRTTAAWACTTSSASSKTFSRNSTPPANGSSTRRPTRFTSIRPPGIDLAKAKVEGVRLRHLVEFRGTRATAGAIRHTSGAYLRHAARTFMDNKEPLLRSDWTIYRGGAVFFNGAEDCSLEDCFYRPGGRQRRLREQLQPPRHGARLPHRSRRAPTASPSSAIRNAVRSAAVRIRQAQAVAKIDRTPGPKTNNYPGRLPGGRLPDLRAPAASKSRRAGVEIAMAPESRCAIARSTTCPARASISATAAGAATSSSSATFRHRQGNRRPRQLQLLGPRPLLGARPRRLNDREVAQNPELPLLDAVEPDHAAQQPLALRSRLGHRPRRWLDELPHLQQSLPARRHQEPRGLLPRRREQHHGRRRVPPARLV